jgi:mono/diheme cytochrome c family protein
MRSATSITMKSLLAIVLGGGALVTVTNLIGCARGGHPSASAATTQPARDTLAATESGAQLWAQTCARCHNLRSPETYSPAQWEVAVHHMRLRANLTGEEAAKIVAFLKSAS